MIRFLLVLCLLAATGPVLASPVEERLSRDAVRRMVIEEASRHSTVPPSLALAVAEAESDFVADAESVAGARGVMQIMPATGRGVFGVEPNALWDPRLNIRLGVRFLGDLIERYDGRWDLALSYYNGGSAVGSGRTARVIPATRRYVEKVLRAERRWARDRTTQALGRMAARVEAGPRHEQVTDRWAGRLVDEADIARRLTAGTGTAKSRRQHFMTLADRALDLAADGHVRAGRSLSSSTLLSRIADRRARFRNLLRNTRTGARPRNLL